MSVKTLDDLLNDGVEGRGVLVRSDFNVPLDADRHITDPGRIIASLPTLKALSDAGAKVIVTAHLGRPKGAPDPKFSLAPVAKALGERLGRHVQLAGDVVGTDALARAEGLTDGDILLLENIRFDPRETSKDAAERTSLAKALVELVGDDAEHPTPMHHHRAVVEPPLEGQGSTHDDDRQEVRGRRPHPFHRGERGVEHGVLEQQVVDRVAGQAQLREDRQRDPLGRALASDAHDRVGVGERIGDRDRHRAGRDAGEPLVVGGVEVHGRSLAHRSTDREGRGAPPQGDDSRGPGVPPAQPSEGAQPSVRRVLPSFSK